MGMGWSQLQSIVCTINVTPRWYSEWGGDGGARERERERDREREEKRERGKRDTEKERDRRERDGTTWNVLTSSSIVLVDIHKLYFVLKYICHGIYK